MLKKCELCNAEFVALRNANYCMSCREERKHATDRAYKKNGANRSLGTTDICIDCNQKYTVNSGNQKRCRACAELHNKSHDRERAIKNYHNNKNTINAKRYPKRRKGEQIKVCDWCGKEFRTNNKSTTCSADCHRFKKNKYAREQRAKLKRGA